jgi:hypothetical protein
LMPGNAGGAKDPDFWCAFEEPRIGDWRMPISTIEIRRHWRELYRKAKTVTIWVLSHSICIEGRVPCALR